MDGSYPSRLRIWESPAAGVVPKPLGAAGDAAAAPSAAGAGESAEELFAREALQPRPALARLDGEAEPYTLQWFLNIESHRHGRQGRWIPRLLEFSKHAGEALLGLGDGLGTDWLQYARNGASVTVCTASASQLALIRRNFELRGLPGRFLHAAPTALPLENACTDVVCVNSLLLDGADDPQAIVAEVFRVLKPGGKVLAVTPAKYDVDFWYDLFFFWDRLFRRRRLSPNRPAVRSSARRLKRLFGQFIEHRIHKRQLRRSEVPHIWRVLPLPLLERFLGRILVVKAFKPLSTAIHNQAAA